MLKTGIYVRVSTEEQAQEGYSIRAQEQKLKDYARIKEWSVYNIYVDEGISGKNIVERPAINKLINDIKEGNVTNVLVFKIDRLTRSTSDLITLVELFNHYDCAFNSLCESIDTQTASGRMFIKIIGIFAEFERENIIERTKLGFERKVKEGYTLATGTVSYGYERKRSQKIQTVNQIEADIVRQVYTLFLNEHMSYLDLAKNLNSRNIPTRKNRQWHARHIKNMLTNVNYIGKVRHHMKSPDGGREYEGKHEAIISNEMFEQVQKLIKNISTKEYTKHSRADKYFSGALFCAECGARMVIHGSYRKKKDGTISASGGYRCHNKMKKLCSASDMSHSKVEKAFSEYIANIEDFNVIDEFKLSTEQDQTIQDDKLRKSLDAELERLKKKSKEITTLYVNDELDFDNYISLKMTLDKETNYISDKIKELDETKKNERQEAIIKEDIIKNLKENWDLLTDEERRQFVINFIDKIVVVNELKNSRCGVVKIKGVTFNKD